MKKLLFSAAFVILYLHVQSQIVFCPQGAEWHFLQKKTGTNFNTPWIYPNETIKYERDTSINAVSAKVLKHRLFYKDNSQGCDITLIKQSGDTVFLRNQFTQHNWQVFYNFNASVGQSWYNSFLSTPGSTSTSRTYTTTVDSIKVISENGFTLKRLFVTQLSSTSQYPSISTISERYGSNVFLFNYSTAYDLGAADPIFNDWIQEFLCYSDNAFGTKQFSSKSCNYQDLTDLPNYDSNTQNILVYPNPVNDFLTIETDGHDNLHVVIFDLFGKKVKSIAFQKNSRIDVRELHSGVYLLMLKNKNELIYNGKIVKE